jgi:DNA-binding NarL/FixJ family response regulator
VQDNREGGVTVVIVVAQGALRRAAWQALLMQQAELEVGGTVSAAVELAGLLPRPGPVAILLDGGAMDGGRVAQVVSVAGGAGVLSVLDDLALTTVVPLLRAGIIGCLPADAPVADLARALVAVGRGEIALPAAIGARALAELARPIAREASTTDELSEREREVVELLVQGQTNKDIAQALFLSVRTIEAHLRSIYAKLGVRSRTEAVLWAIAQTQREVGR